MKISKQIEWDMGHRVPNHRSKCRNLHGHRYRAEICLEGKLINIEGASEQGMIKDFSKIKEIALKHIHDVLDHGFMVWEKDKLLVEFFSKNPDLKYKIVSFIPTAENIAAWIFIELDKYFKDKYNTGLRLRYIKVWETPTSIAIFSRNDLDHLR